MKHLGDITKISGYTAPVVDVVIGGSPCQDLSVAGKRAGLDGERSGLYMEQVRIIKEMRDREIRSGRTGVDVRPRYMVWENVPGAFSSNKGEDFRIVLEEIAKIKDSDAVIPRPPKGKWTTCGCVMGDGWSIAWRVLDAQFWGVPQRRRRIALVADFGGESAPEILFVRKGVRGDIEASGTERQGVAADAERSLGAGDREGAVFGFDGYNADITGDKSSSLGVNCGKVTGRNGVVYAMDRASFNQGENAQFQFEISDDGISSPLVAKGPSAVCYSTGHGTFHTIAEEGICATLQASDYKDPPTATYRYENRYVVRRITPLECERLQGYPDGWTDIGEYISSEGKKMKTSDAARYKALGNSIARPPWKWVLKRLCACYERDATMASLFDGIGGFPYIWEQINGKGSCLWGSEIEEFPMAVTKARIGNG